MVIVDNNKNIQRIIDEVLGDTDLFDDGATVGKLREVIFGNPDNNNKKAIDQKPALYVTTKDSIQNSRYNFGYVEDNNQNQVSVEYELVLVATANSRTRESQKQIYDLLKNLRKLAENNRRFSDSKTDNSPRNVLFWTLLGTQPGTFTIWEDGEVYAINDNIVDNGKFYVCIQANTSNDGDPIFARSVINSVKWDSQTRGKLITSISVTLLATIGESFIGSFPGIGNLLLLSKPNAPEGIVFSDDREQKPTPNRVISENGDFGAVFVEYESTVALDDAFRLKFGSEEDITIISASGSHTYHIQYIDINPTAQWDAIERTVLHMEIIPV